MNRKDKKIKAAIAGVVALLKQQAKDEKIRELNRWVRFGREQIMRNNYLVQRRELWRR